MREVPKPGRLVRASAASPGRVGCGCLVVVGIVVVLLVGLFWPSGPDVEPEAAPAPTAASGPDQVESCRRVAVGFVTVFMDRTEPDAGWRRMVKSWVAPEVAPLIDSIDRARVPVRRVAEARVSAQPGSCDVDVAFADGHDGLPVVVDNAAGSWKVRSWGS